MTPIALFVLALALPLGCPSCSRTAVANHPGVGAVGRHPQIRSLDRLTDAILERGLRESSTLCDLNDRLGASPVIAYVETALGMPTRGALTFMAASAGTTYVLIRIDLRQTQEERVATLAHELTHALEVASARPTIRSAADLAGLYRTIGRPSVSGRDFESAAAIANERRVRHEIASGATRRPRRLASE
jgi:hypothetical protein